MEHAAKDGHTVISITEAETSYLHELNLSQKSVTQINKNLRLIESEITLLAAAKESAIKDMETMIKVAKEQLEQQRKSLLNNILEQFNAQQIILLDRQKQIKEVHAVVNKNITQAKDFTKTGNLRRLKHITENLKELHDKRGPFFSDLDLGENYLAFDSKKGLDEFNKSSVKLGEIYSKGFLPSMVKFGTTEATAGHSATLTVEICNHHGNKFLISPDTFSVQVTDPTGTKVSTVLNTTGSECTVTFTPEICGLHKVTGIFLGQRLIIEETHISVGSNEPVLKFGKRGQGSGTMNVPWGIAIDSENCLYVADVGNRLIQKFTADGEFMSEFSVALHNKDYTTVDMAIDLNRRLLFCVEILNENNKLVKGKNILAFNFEGELQHTYTPSNISNSYFIATNQQGEFILSDYAEGCLFKVDREGNFLSRIADLKCPGYIVINEDDSIIVPDESNDCVYIFNPDGSIRHKFGSSGTEKGQLKQPCGVATDGEYILVGEAGNNRIQVFTNNGTFVSIIESSEDPLSQPRGLAVTQDGHVYVADTGNHCIKKYKYKDVHWFQVQCMLTSIGSDKGLLPGRHQAIIWTNSGILLIGPLGTNFSEILIKIQTFSLQKICLNMPSAKWRPFFPGGEELINR